MRDFRKRIHLADLHPCERQSSGKNQEETIHTYGSLLQLHIEFLQ